MNCPPEHDEQVLVIQWAACHLRKYPDLDMLYAVPNGGLRGKVVARKLKAEGVKAGVPDLVLAAPMGGYHGLYLEMKRRKGSKVQADQKDWLTRLQEAGYCCCVCKGFASAKETLIAYLEGKPVPHQYPEVMT